MDLFPGIYEQLINKYISEGLSSSQFLCEKAKLDAAESSKILAKYLADILEKVFVQLQEKDTTLEKQISLANEILSFVQDKTQVSIDAFKITEEAEQLFALIEPQNNIQSLSSKPCLIRPETSLAQSSLFTGAPKEPQLFSELKKEILSCNRIDMLVSFIKWTGLRMIFDELKIFTAKGGKLRIITTSYMGATDIKAIEYLGSLPNTEIKVSYDTKQTRLHAKAYIFVRDTGFTTAYIGSSNLSNSALSTGLEWNIKVTKQDLPETIKKVSATFESYWNSSRFENYSPDRRDYLAHALQKERGTLTDSQINFTFDITPYPYQQDILNKIDAERSIRGNFKNLIVAATGTGKTVISALDYKNFCKTTKRQPKLLFIAHREEILKQSLACFRTVLKDSNFGDLFVGTHRPTQLDHLFMSIQTFNSQDFTRVTTPDNYDYIVVDEFHHAAAQSYQRLLNYYTPHILLGLTATPERLDGKSILHFFNGKITAEIRLPEAINRGLLCPFQYFGVTDETANLADIRWINGGYDKGELSHLYTEDKKTAHKRADLIIESVRKYVTTLKETKGLGFCVTQKHAEFMAHSFHNAGIPAVCLTSNSSSEERNSAQDKLKKGNIKFIFTVDLYNEGVDIPEVNTVLFLRPTESLTIFLQQLGRGLRLADNKECLTVLDFIGQAHKKYNFEIKFSSILNNSSKDISTEIEKGFISVPKGCYIHLEKQAAKYILENIKSSLSTGRGLNSRIQTFTEDSGTPLTLANFLTYYQLDIRSFYAREISFARRCVLASCRPDFNEPDEKLISNALPTLSAINSRRWLTFLLKVLPNIENYAMEHFSAAEKRLLNMTLITLWKKGGQNLSFPSPLDALRQLKNSPILFEEILDVLRYNLDHVDFIDEGVELGFESPLDLHCRYSRDQIFTAFDIADPSSIRQGVRYIADKKIDVFIVTLNKSEKDYSPTTMYNDYSINEYLFHWQSQSTTSADSPTGLRYINHAQQGSKVLLFVRENKKEFEQTAPFTFLGTAQYIAHEGSNPMNITWRLDKAIPADFLKKSNKLLED